MSHDSCRGCPRAPRHARLVGVAMLSAASLVALVACTPDLQSPTEVAAAAGPRLSLAAMPAGMSLQCMPREGVRARAVAVGTGDDENGNGVVCDERLGAFAFDESAPPAGLVVTSDDVPLPTPSDPAPATGS